MSHGCIIVNYKILDVSEGPVITTTFSMDSKPDIQSYLLLLDNEGEEHSLGNRFQTRLLFKGTKPFQVGQEVDYFALSPDDSKTVKCKITSVKETPPISKEDSHVAWEIITDAFDATLKVYDYTSRSANYKDAKNAPAVGQDVTVTLYLDPAGIRASIGEL